MEFAGGCQCGAIRYRAAAPRGRASICYCRMCQKASGGPFMAFVRFPAKQVAWSKPPAVFGSSDIVERGFCPDCGTPLTYRRIASDNVSLTLHSLDDPEAITPEIVFAPEKQVAWCRALADIPEAPETLDESAFVNHQHPDEVSALR